MAIIPANEALQLQEAKKQEYKDKVFEKRLKYAEQQFNHAIRKAHRTAVSVTIPWYFWPHDQEKTNLELNEYLELVRRVKEAGYHIEVENTSFRLTLIGGRTNCFLAFFETPAVKPWWKIW